MPGNVLATHIKEGDTVEQGQLLLILEAMKMEHRITAPITEAGDLPPCPTGMIDDPAGDVYLAGQKI